jgi:hypothetical protein
MQRSVLKDRFLLEKKMPLLFDLVAKTGEKYTDKEGKERDSLVNVGALLETKEGRKFIKIKCLPVNFDGYISMMRPREKNGGDAPKERAPEPKRVDPDEDIPF